MYTSKPRPGKFEGNRSQALAQAVYDSTLSSAEWEYEEFGGGNSGAWAAIVLGRRISYLMDVDSNGFVQVWIFENHEIGKEQFARFCENKRKEFGDD